MCNIKAVSEIVLSGVMADTSRLNPNEGTTSSGELKFYTKDFGTTSLNMALFANPEKVG